jgi:hypothetical protein
VNEPNCFELHRVGDPNGPVKLCRCFTPEEAAECWHVFNDHRRLLKVSEWVVVLNEGSNVTDGVLEVHAGHSLAGVAA